MYAHDLSYMPEGGWWNEPNPAEALSKINAPPNKKPGKAAKKGLGRQRRRQLHSDYGLGEFDEELMEQRGRNCGFTDAECEELYSQGVKPWDDDAWVSL